MSAETTLPSVFLVGAGAVATALAGAFARAGVHVSGLWARRAEAASASASAAGVSGFGPALPAALGEAEVVVLAVRDDAIAEVADALWQAGALRPTQVLVHCSGARAAADALGITATRVAGAATMHPLRAITASASATSTLAGTIFGIEGDARGLPLVRALVSAIGGKALALAAEHMTLYHAAAAVASNYTVALIDAAVALLARAGITEAEALAALVPLVEGSVANVAAHGIAGGLTGPIRRGDRDTVERHLGALDALDDDPESARLYRVLGLRATDIARRQRGRTTPAHDAIEALLREPSAPNSKAADPGAGDEH
ncbi:Rossmann-like and DUF2520 domain-containing protein [Haliangium ochraceum]|uniref:DUF2520 domain-containing protein n=1 Tax=Haliangium ochraceum (strain DSM 14365 / JCM 11303 / SMP-2) TaxID=502025 RepID=D0LY69_HALO1|nr:Rossmann-like and DUF2520 domain-containing protein [Haliangium ochraceum]ACY16219.1 Domain of unknown function DUF2520 [Haliangium ochraceum DSM 14365]